LENIPQKYEKNRAVQFGFLRSESITSIKISFSKSKLEAPKCHLTGESSSLRDSN